jgi:hypothetical protein
MRANNGIRLLKTLRGEGALSWGKRGSRAVSYCIDLYGQGRFLSADGDVRGDLADLVGRTPSNARLRLASGEEVRFAFCSIEADMASIELLNPVSAALAAGEPSSLADEIRAS